MFEHTYSYIHVVMESEPVFDCYCLFC